MPLYQYECRTCGKRFDELKRLSERDQPVTCPECGAAAQRVLAGFAVGRGGGGHAAVSSSSSSSCSSGGA